MRNELHTLARGNAIKRRDEILKAYGQRAERGNNRFTDRRPESGHLKTTSEIAKDMGVSKSKLLEEKQIARDILPEAQEAIKAADLPKTDALKIARMKPQEQMKVAERLSEGAKSYADAIREIKRDEVTTNRHHHQTRPPGGR